MKLFPFFLMLISTALIAQDPGQFTWPNGAEAAICLTYDDGLACHVDRVVPALNKVGLKGSFYCTGNSESLKNDMVKWRQLVLDGHELGNHSLYHPCQKVKDGRESFAWVKAEYDYNHYNKEQLLAELGLSNTLLSAVDGIQQRTFAYTCSDHQVSGESFVEDIRPLFSAARIDGPIPDSMENLDLMFMPSWGVEEHSGAEMIAYVEDAAKKGTIGTFMFHGVGSDYLKVSTEAHQELIEYLAQNQHRYYVATFKEITDYIRQNRNY